MSGKSPTGHRQFFLQNDRLVLPSIVASMGMITVANCASTMGLFGFPFCFNRLYAIPIAYAAMHFRLKGGLLAAVASTALVLGLDWLGWHDAGQNVVIEVVLFYLLAWFIAHYFNEKQRREEEIARRDRELAALHEQMARAERLNSLSVLVAGVSHEIRNPLGIIQLTAQNLQERSRQNPDLSRYASVISEEADRLNRVLQRFLDFARPGDLEFTPVNVHGLLDDVLMLTGKYLEHRGVSVERRLPAHLPLLRGAPDQLKQVFVNLILNAVEAMPEGGRLTISADVGSDVENVAITFRDTGVGIPPEVLPRLYDPFYTTKTTGSGLGLSIVHRLIDLHKGYIEVESEPGQGTSFVLYLPVYEEVEAADAATDSRSGRREEYAVVPEPGA